MKSLLSQLCQSSGALSSAMDSPLEGVSRETRLKQGRSRGLGGSFHMFEGKSAVSEF